MNRKATQDEINAFHERSTVSHIRETTPTVTNVNGELRLTRTWNGICGLRIIATRLLNPADGEAAPTVIQAIKGHRDDALNVVGVGVIGDGDRESVETATRLMIHTHAGQWITVAPLAKARIDRLTRHCLQEVRRNLKAARSVSDAMYLNERDLLGADRLGL